MIQMNLDYGNKHEARNRCVAIVAVFMFMAVAISPVVSTADGDGDMDIWACSLTLNSNTGEVSVSYTVNGESKDTTPVTGANGATSGSIWYYNASTGYGPYNSFYAAFDADGKLVCHLNPYDLTKNINGTSISDGGYNIMWCIPKFYVSVSDNTYTMTNDSSAGSISSAFVMGNKIYDYMAIGVYEATYEMKIFETEGEEEEKALLGSKSGQTSLTNTGILEMRSAAGRNTKVDSGDGVKLSVLWNYYQWQAYRICSIAAMGTFDSQSQIGMGNVASTGASTAGSMDAKGAYYGSTSTTEGVKVFIENSWGSLWEYVDDTYLIEDGLYAGTQSVPKGYVDDDGTYEDSTERKTKTSVAVGKDGYGSTPYSTQMDSWGLPTNTSTSSSSTALDYFSTNNYVRLMRAGGGYGDGNAAGISAFVTSRGLDEADHGGRLVFMFGDATVIEHETHSSDSSTSPLIYVAIVIIIVAVAACLYLKFRKVP